MTEEHENSRVAMLVARFMAQVERVADDDDWAESDGWLGRMVLWSPKGEQC